MREAMPVSVMKPTMEATDRGWPADPQRGDAADQSERHAAHDDQRQDRGAIAAVEDGEDGREREQRQQPDGPARVLLRLERAFDRGEDALRQHSCGQFAPDIGNEPRHVRGAIGIGEHDRAPLAVLAQDLIGAVAFPDLRDVADRHPAIGRLKKQIAEPLRGAPGVVEAHHDVETARAVHQLRDHPAVRQALEMLGHSLGLQAVERSTRVVDDDIELGNAHLLLDLQVCETRNARQTPPKGFRQHTQCIEVLAEELDGDLGPHAREHMVEPVRDGLADVERNGQHRKACSQIGEDRVLARARLP